jgi:outer membrane scaffolding protein for murein synthesis (MipA/OmpV family)
LGAQPPADFDSIESWQPKVEDDHIMVARERESQSALSIDGQIDLVSGLLELFGQVRVERRVVFDQEDAHAPMVRRAREHEWRRLSRVVDSTPRRRGIDGGCDAFACMMPRMKLQLLLSCLAASNSAIANQPVASTSSARLVEAVGFLQETQVPPTVPSSERDALVPLPSVLDFTRGGGWGVALGLGVEYEAAYDGSDEYEIELDPAGAIQWRSGDHMVFYEGTELGWRGVVEQRWLLQAGLRYEDGLDPSDSEDGALDGIEKRDSHLTGFFEARWALDDEWRNWIGGRVLAGESDFGALGVLAAGHRFGEALDGMGTEAYLFATFSDSSFVNKDFGVSAEDAAGSGLAETKLDGGYRSTGLQVVHRRRFTEHLQLLSQAGVELYNSQIADSPIARDDFEAEVSLALVWQF